MSPLALSLHFLQAQPDSRLVALAREGHTPAFEALVRRYRKELLTYCRRLQPRSGSAEDALQQTLLQAWKALSAGAEIRDLRPWLYRIAHNVSLNQLRAPVSVPHDLSEAAGAQEVHQLVEQRLQARAALAGMAALPPLQRDVFISTILDGASHEQVASSLGLSSGAVRGLIYRARATLRSAAAALIPSPTVQWALRRAETRAGAAPAVSEMLAGGGGAGVAAAVVKGGAVLTLAGAVAGAGGVILTHRWNHHRPQARLAGPWARAQAQSPMAQFRAAADKLGPGFSLSAASGRSANVGQAVSGATGERGRDSGSLGKDHADSGGGSTDDHGGRSQGGSDGGSSSSTSGRSDGGSTAGATIASSGDGGSVNGSGGSSGSSDGGSSSSSTTSTSTSSGSDGGSTGSGSSSGDLLTTVSTTSDGGSGSDGGSSTTTTSSSGSGDTTTTTTSTTSH